MSVTVLEAATGVLWLCEVTDVLDELPEPVDLVERFVAAATASIQRTCGRVFAQQEYQEVQGGSRSPWLHLSRRPIVSVSAVSADGQAITDYRIESAEAGLLYRRGGWGLPSATWTVDYTAGFLLPGQTTPPDDTGPTLPEDIQRACIETAKVWWSERNISERVASKTFGLTGDRIDFRVSATHESLPPLARQLLYPWMVRAVA